MDIINTPLFYTCPSKTHDTVDNRAPPTAYVRHKLCGFFLDRDISPRRDSATLACTRPSSRSPKICTATSPLLSVDPTNPAFGASGKIALVLEAALVTQFSPHRVYRRPCQPRRLKTTTSLHSTERPKSHSAWKRHFPRQRQHNPFLPFKGSWRLTFSAGTMKTRHPDGKDGSRRMVDSTL